MAVKQKKRRWSAEEKISICLQTPPPGVSVAQVARRYALNANLISNGYAMTDMLAVWMLCQNLIVQYSCQSRLKDQPVQHPFCPLPRLAVSRSSFPAGVGSLPKVGLMQMC